MNVKQEGVAVIDFAGRLLYVNSIFARLHGYHPEELSGETLTYIINNEKESYLKQLTEVNDERRLLTLKAVHHRKGGIPIPVSVTALFPAEKGSSPGHIILIIREAHWDKPGSEISTNMGKDKDITAHESVDRIGQLFKLIADEASDAVILAAPDGKIEYANRISSDIFGMPLKEIARLNLQKLLPDNYRDEFKKLLSNPADLRSWSAEYTKQDDNGSKRILKFSIIAVCNAEGESENLICRVRDVTELRLMENHLRQAQKLEAIGLLASGLAHNINSPLSAIIMTAEMAQSNHPDIADFDDILMASSRIREILSNLMTKSRFEQSSEQMEIDVNQLIQTELKFLEANLFFKHSVECEVQLDRNLPTIKGVYSHFSQCFQNILANALDSMSETQENKLVVKTVLDDDNRITLSVKDNGCGISKDNLKKIFIPFFTTKSHLGEEDQNGPSGTGLGLSTARNLLNRYDATIEVDSKLDRGSEFRIRIPVSSNT